MNGAQSALDGLINLGIAYVVMSVVGSAIVELVFQLLRIRGRILGNTIRGLLGASTRAFYALPTINGLRQTGWLRRPVGDPVVSASAKAMERLRIGSAEAVEADADEAVDFIDAASFADAFETLDRQRKLPASLSGPEAPFRYKGGEIQLDQVRRWFEQAMEATTRQYRRTVQVALLILGTLMAAAAQVDSLGALQTAFQAKNPLAAPAWLGFLTTGAAVALGAQYWFDAVGKLIGLRTKAVSAGLWGRAARRPQ